MAGRIAVLRAGAARLHGGVRNALGSLIADGINPAVEYGGRSVSFGRYWH